MPKKVTKKVLDFLSPSKHDSEFNDSGEEQKVHNVSRGSKSTPQQKSVTPKSTTPQQKTVTPKVITPKQKSVTPKSATPQQKTVTPKVNKKEFNVLINNLNFRTSRSKDLH